ncbi:hypothetical protein Rruber_05493 (plasmid) [Rhodococcus ruber]
MCAAGAPRTAPEVDETPVGGARRCAQRVAVAAARAHPPGRPRIPSGVGRAVVVPAAQPADPLPALCRCRWGVPIGDGPGGRSRSLGAGGLARPRAGPHGRAPSEDMCSGAGDPGYPVVAPEAGRPPLSRVIALQRPNRCRGGSGPPAATSKEQAGVPFLRTADRAAFGGTAAARPDPARPGDLYPKTWASCTCGLRRAASGSTRGVLRSARTRSLRWGGTRRFHCGRRCADRRRLRSRRASRMAAPRGPDPAGGYRSNREN